MAYKDPAKRAAWYEKRYARRAEWFSDKKCVKCGSIDHLELDHIDPSTKVSHRIWLWNDERLNSELIKCQPLCFSCHKKKSATEQPKGADSHAARITENDVRMIRASNESRAILANRYGISTSHVSRIRSGNKWKHVN